MSQREETLEFWRSKRENITHQVFLCLTLFQVFLQVPSHSLLTLTFLYSLTLAFSVLHFIAIAVYLHTIYTQTPGLRRLS